MAGYMSKHATPTKQNFSVQGTALNKTFLKDVLTCCQTGLLKRIPQRIHIVLRDETENAPQNKTPPKQTAQS